jgi:hypothetical protein
MTNRDNRSRNRLWGHVHVPSPKSGQDKTFTGGPGPRRSTWSKETSLNSRKLSALSRLWIEKVNIKNEEHYQIKCTQDLALEGD